MNALKIAMISLLVLLFIPRMVSADDGNILFYYSKSSMTPSKISLDDLDKMTFNENGIQMWTQNGISQIPYDDFLLFTFKEIEHPYISVVTPPLSPQNIRISYNNNRKTLIVKSDIPLNFVGIYDLQGSIVMSNTTLGKDNYIYLPLATNGIYFVKVKYGDKVIVKKIVL